MFSRLARTSFVLGTVAFALLGGAQPISAAVGQGQTGTVGYYSLNDTSGHAGANAIYKDDRTVSGYWKLRKIVVHAPDVRAVSGKSSQKVGWDFTIQRQYCTYYGSNAGCGSWSKLHTSSIFTATTGDSTNASFVDESLGIKLPTYPTFGEDYHYRAIVKMFWYRPNGSVQGTATARVYYYKSVMGTTSSTHTQYCWDYR